ncbi:MFS general substrate transporter [Trametes maxima]|nr:MFS general substrate transporter [Trametes maxima]
MTARSRSYTNVPATADADEPEPLVAKQHAKPNPLPVFQLAVIYAIKLTLPITSTQSIPYFNLLIEKLAASEGAETGYYSGIAHTAFSITSFISMFAWGRISDSKGRVLVIFLGTAGTAVFTLLFGLSTTFTGVLINRLLGGFFHGITGAIHSVVGELSDETNQSTAFPLYDIISALGFVIGPLIGGTFADPAKEWPDVFTHPIWKTYPYLLPCLISAVISVVAALLSAFVLEETLPSKRKAKPFILEEEEPLLPEATTATVIDVAPTMADLEPLSIRELLSIPVLRAVFASSAVLGLAGSCYTNVFVLMAYTPLRQGGLAFSPAQIGRAISSMGAVSILLKLCMPRLLRRFGTLNMFDFCMVAWTATFAAMPFASFVAQRAAATATLLDVSKDSLREVSTAEWSAVALVLFLSRLGCLAFSIIMILTRDHTPGSASLGTANGLAELAQSLATMVGPTVASSLFAWSATHHLLGGHLWVVFMLAQSGFGSWVARRIRKYRD